MNSENANIMKVEQRIDVLRERLEDACESGLPDEAGLRQELAGAEAELAKLQSPFVDGAAAA